MAVQKKVDVVTVGAGWSANILAWKLAEAGYRVLSLEQGPWEWAAPNAAYKHDGLLYPVRKRMMTNIKKESWTWRPHPRAPSLPMRQFGGFLPGQGVGGAAAHWSGMLYRFLPSDFQVRTHVVERYGQEKIPENMLLQDWPVTYEELEPYYDQFEWDIGASGLPSRENGHVLEGGNPYEPRRTLYPNPPLTPGLSSTLFAEACRQLGYTPFPQPSGILSRTYTDRFGRTRSGCLYCGFCSRYGCENDSKSTGLTTHLPLALQTGLHEVRAHCHVTRVEAGPDGLAAGVTYVDDRTGEEHFQPADVVILAAYTLTNVKLLLVSQDWHHPGGIGNDRGMLGQNFTHQMWYSPVVGQFDGRRFNLYMGNTSNTYSIYDFYGMLFDHTRLDFLGGAGIYSTWGEREPVSSAGFLPLGTGKNSQLVSAVENGDPPSKPPRSWGWEWKEALRSHWDNFVPIAIQGDSFAYRGHTFDLDPHFRDAYGQPLLRFTFDWQDDDRQRYRFITGRCLEIMRAMGASAISAIPTLEDYNLTTYKGTHISGGAIMGTDPGNSVTNKFGQVWDTPNVFVTGAALYPQNPGSNPTNTLAALAYMTGDALVERYFRAPNRLMG